MRLLLFLKIVLFFELIQISQEFIRQCALQLIDLVVWKPFATNRENVKTLQTNKKTYYTCTLFERLCDFLTSLQFTSASVHTLSQSNSKSPLQKRPGRLHFAYSSSSTAPLLSTSSTVDGITNSLTISQSLDPHFDPSQTEMEEGRRTRRSRGSLPPFPGISNSDRRLCRQTSISAFSHYPTIVIRCCYNNLHSSVVQIIVDHLKSHILVSNLLHRRLERHQSMHILSDQRAVLKGRKRDVRHEVSMLHEAIRSLQ